MKKIIRNKKLVLWTVAVLAVLGIAGKLTYSYVFPEYPRRATAQEQTAHIKRILARDSLKADVRLCEQITGRIKDPKTTALLVDEVQLEALHVMAEKARAYPLSHDWHSFFYGALIYESRALRPLSARLVRELETADAETIEKVGLVIMAVIYNGGWSYSSDVSKGSVAADLLERDRAAWKTLLNTFLAKARATPGGQAAADNVIAHIAERHDDFEYDKFEGAPTHLSVNRQLLDGPAGDAMIELLGEWRDPARGEAATRLMSALMRHNPRTDGWWAAQNNARIGEALRRELAASSEQGAPAQVGKILTEQLLARQRPKEAAFDPGAAAERLEQILLDGEIPLTERTCRAVSLQGKRTPDPGLLDLVDAAGSGRAKLELLAAVPGWAPELVEEAKAQGTEPALHEMHKLVFRLGRRGAQPELRDDCIRYLGGLTLGEGTKDTELRVEAAGSLALGLRHESPAEHRELRQKVEALALPAVKGNRISVPKAPLDLRLEILMHMHLINPETSLYEICLAHYDKLPTDYKWASAYSAARAVEAPKATGLFIRVLQDESLADENLKRFPMILATNSMQYYLMLRLRLPMTEELVEAIINTPLVREQEKQSFLRGRQAE